MHDLTLQEYDALTPDRVMDAVDATGRICDARVLALNSYENRVYQVGIEDGTPLIAKFYRPSRWSDAQILEEHAFQRELLAAEIPVVAPLADANGQTLYTMGGYRYALFPRLGGQPPEPGDLDQLHRLGMQLGRMHTVARQHRFQARPALTIERYFDMPVRAVCEPGFLPESLRAPYLKTVERLRAQLAVSGITTVSTIRSHGDMHPGNILWTRDDGPWWVDFDDCQHAPAVQDLWMLLTGVQHEQEIQLAELLDGYSTFADFDVSELSLIEPLRTLRMVHYAGWLATRWQDPAFPRYFPWFNTEACWQAHLADLVVQSERMNEPPLRAL